MYPVDDSTLFVVYQEADNLLYIYNTNTGRRTAVESDFIMGSYSALYRYYDGNAFLYSFLGSLYRIDAQNGKAELWLDGISEPEIWYMDGLGMEVCVQAKTEYHHWSSSHSKWISTIIPSRNLSGLVLLDTGTTLRSEGYSIEMTTDYGITWVNKGRLSNSDVDGDPDEGCVYLASHHGLVKYSYKPESIYVIDTASCAQVALSDNAWIATVNSSGMIRIYHDEIYHHTAEPMLGPATILDIAISQNDLLYVMTDSILYSYNMYLRVWSTLMLDTSYGMKSLHIDVYGNIYLLKSGIVVYSTDSGDSWVELQGIQKMGVIVTMTTDENYLYAATERSGVYKIEMSSILDVDVELYMNRAPLFFEIYPNPTSESVTICMKITPKHHGTLRVINQIGRVVYKCDIPSGERHITWDASNASSGLYFIQILFEGGFEVGKVLVR